MFVKQGICSKTHVSKICSLIGRCNDCNREIKLFKTKELLKKCPHCGSENVIEISKKEDNILDVENRNKQL